MKRRGDVVREVEERQARFDDGPKVIVPVPHSDITEQVILAAMMVDRDVRKRLLPICPSDAFYDEQSRIIREGLAELERKGLEFDPADLMRAAPDADMRIVERLPAARPDVPPNLEQQVKNLLWDWRLAKFAEGPLSAMIEAIQNPKREEPDKMRALARRVAEAFDGEDGPARYLRDPKEVVRQAVESLKKRVAGEAHYVPFGLPDHFDYYEDGSRRIQPGAAPGMVTMITSNSGAGKSTLTAHVVNGLRRQGISVLYGAWEEGAKLTIELLAVLDLKWSRTRVLNGRSNRLRKVGEAGDWTPMTSEEIVIFEDKCHEITRHVRFFDNPFQHGRARTSRALTNDDQLDVIHEHVAMACCKVFVGDLLQRGLVDDRPSDERQALFRFLAILEEEQVHGLITHQQRKDVEQRASKVPTRDGAIGAGAWIDISTTVLAPYIPAKWKSVDDTTFEIHVLKQRFGKWPLATEMRWNPDTGQIWNGRDVPVVRNAETGTPMIKQEGKKRHFGGKVT